MVGGIRPSAGVVLPLLPPALLHYTINRRKLQAVRQKICAKKVKMLGGCALRGTGSPCRCGKLNGGGLPRRCRRGGRQRYPAGGLPGWSPAYPAFNLLSCPLSPHPPSPVGKGETQSLFRRGLRPRHPCIKPLAALTEPAKQVPGGGRGGGCSPCGTWFPCPGGEDHLKRRRRLRRIVPSPPVPPLLGCRHCS